MIEFGQALARLLPIEDGYANNPADRGGETYKGISRKAHPTWRGWNRIDAAKSRPGFPACLEQDTELQTLVRQLYRAEYWRDEFEKLPSQDLANKVFDLAVNAGGRVAVKLLQRACRAVGFPEVADDGSFGPATAAALEHANQTALLVALRSESAGYYRSIVAHDPSQGVFLNGWLRRAYL